tara:strand:+ start:856 stop:1098 length:243 start_codon:yes stop_codon:yes gene_type:complete
MKNHLMTKIFTIIFFILASTNLYAATATCLAGECDIFMSIHYEWVETNCMQSLFFEEVETSFMYFEIVETGQRCTVWDSR